MKKIYIAVLLPIIFGFIKGSLCPQEPLCDCRRNTGMFDIFCFNITTLQPVSELLYGQFYNFTINNLILKKDCYLFTLPNHAFEKISLSVFLTSCPFSDIPVDVFLSTKVLYKIDMERTNFTTIPSGLQNLKHLKSLKLTSNCITSLNSELWNLTLLAEVDFNHGALEELSQDAFAKTPFIQKIDLSFNRLRYIHSDTFKTLQLLRNIKLSGNQISSVRGLFKNINPEVIDLYSNNLTSLDKVFGANMWKLKSLNIGRNRFDYISSSYFRSKFPYLVIFDMTGAKCAEIDSELFRSFSRLAQVILAHNRLQNVPVTLFHNLLSLQYVNLSFNAITSVDGLFNNTPNIRILALSHNKISAIRYSLQNLRKLKKLYLSNNNIHHISSTDFMGLDELEHIYLTYNKIHIIEFRSFSGLQKLEVLMLSNNGFNHLNNSLQNLFSLRLLSICSTLLEKLDHEEFRGLTKLSTLRLINNKIKILSGEFQDLRSLRTFNIAKNKLTTLSKDIFPEIKKLKVLRLGANKLRCDCRLIWFIEWLAKRKHIHHRILQDKPLCHLPPRMLGKPIESLTIEELTEWPENCPVTCQCQCVVDKGPEGFHVKVDCSKRNLVAIPDFFPEYLGDLDLSGNELDSMTKLSRRLRGNLTSLNFEQNKITTLDMDFPQNLTELRLAGNLLQRLSWSVLPRNSLQVLTLANNSWICDCETVDFKKWLLSEDDIVVDVNETRCGHTGPHPKLYGKVITSLKDTQLCPSLISVYVALAIGILCCLLLLTSMVIAYSRYRLYVKVWLYAHGCTWAKDDDKDMDKTFDALISYHRTDEAFVFQDIVFNLEQKEPKFTLCIPERDFVCGEFTNVLEMKAVEDSKRIIVILTQEYMNDAFCMSIFQLAFQQSLEEKVHRVILIKLGDIPKSEDMNPELKITLESKSCISSGEPLFWEKLRYAMPKIKTKQTEKNQWTDSVELSAASPIIEDDSDNDDSDVTFLLG